MRRRSMTIALTLAVAVPWVAIAGDEGALAGTSQAWIDAYNNGDAAAIAAMMTEDAMVLPPGAEPVKGRDAIEDFWAAAIAIGLKGNLDPLEASIDGDLGYKMGTYELLTPEGDRVDHGKWIEVWKNVDGEWLMHRDIYNSSVAPMTEDETVEE